MKGNKLLLVFLLAVGLFGLFRSDALAIEEEPVKVEVLSVEEGECKSYDENMYEGSEDRCRLVEAKLLEGENEGGLIEILENKTENPLTETRDYKEGQRLFVNKAEISGETIYSIVEVDRSSGLWVIVIIFVVAVIAVGRFQGVMSILGMVLSVLAIFGVVVPLILKGKDPILAGGAAAFAVLVLSIYLAHGFNRKTTLALIGTTITLVITVITAYIFISIVKLEGFGSEEAFYLINSSEISISMSKVLTASLILGAVGLLDDVTVSQVSVVLTLSEENPDMSTKELFAKAMRIGKDHIASMVNTLFLVYASASLPMVLLFRIQEVQFSRIVHYEQFAEEIVRTIVGSIGLVLAVPITTYIAIQSVKKKGVNQFMN